VVTGHFIVQGRRTDHHRRLGGGGVLTQKVTWRWQLRNRRWGGCYTADICLLLTLQYGGTTWSWGSGRIVALLMLFGIFLLLFSIFQLSLGEAATWPKRIASHRSMFFGSVFLLPRRKLPYRLLHVRCSTHDKDHLADSAVDHTICKPSRATMRSWRAWGSFR